MQLQIQLFLILLWPVWSQSIHLPQQGISLPFRPVASKRVSTVCFITRTVTLSKEYNLRAHDKHFNDIVSLWTAIFLESELANNIPEAPIQQTNPECRDLRAIVMDAIKSVSELLNANLFVRQRRGIRRHPTLYNKSAQLTIKLRQPKTKRSFLLKSALSLMGSHLASWSLDRALGASKGPLMPVGGSILAMAFGVARKEDLDLQNRKIGVLSNQFINLRRHHNNFANITKLVLHEMQELISRNDERITQLFNTTDIKLKTHAR